LSSFPLSPTDQQSNDCDYFLAVGVHSAITARLAELAGFDAVWVSSLEVSTEKGLPDFNLITIPEMAMCVREVRRTTALPILVDGDNGYGSGDTWVRAAQEYAAAGAAAMCVEDYRFPKRGSFYNDVDRGLEDLPVFARRIERVKKAVPELALIARTEALVAGLGAAEAKRRARAYVAAGADALFIQTIGSTISEFISVLDSLKGLSPIVVTPTKMAETGAAELHQMGADVIIYSNVVIRTMITALRASLTELRASEKLVAVDDRMAALADIFELTDAQAWLTDQQLEAKAYSPVPVAAYGGGAGS
jgi:phosphoenolpyruvate phosphomutase